jgi:hypothetical protein
LFEKVHPRTQYKQKIENAKKEQLNMEKKINTQYLRGSSNVTEIYKGEKLHYDFKINQTFYIQCPKRLPMHVFHRS